VVGLSKAFALAGASDEARSIRDEVGFFQAIRAALIKSLPGDGRRTPLDRELAIQQLVSRAVVSTEIVDVMKAAGIQTPTSRSCRTSSSRRCATPIRRTSPSKP
jgi:type I restriction enzyme R subunit